MITNFSAGAYLKRILGKNEKICAGNYLLVILNSRTLKTSHETVKGTIDKAELHSSGRYLTYSIICSFTYKEQFYNIELSVSDIFPFVGSVYKEYPVGNTTFLINYEFDIDLSQKQAAKRHGRTGLKYC